MLHIRMQWFLISYQPIMRLHLDHKCHSLLQIHLHRLADLIIIWLVYIFYFTCLNHQSSSSLERSEATIKSVVHGLHKSKLWFVLKQKGCVLVLVYRWKLIEREYCGRAFGLNVSGNVTFISIKMVQVIHISVGPKTKLQRKPDVFHYFQNGNKNGKISFNHISTHFWSSEYDSFKNQFYKKANHNAYVL